MVEHIVRARNGSTKNALYKLEQWGHSSAAVGSENK